MNTDHSLVALSLFCIGCFCLIMTELLYDNSIFYSFLSYFLRTFMSNFFKLFFYNFYEQFFITFFTRLSWNFFSKTLMSNFLWHYFTGLSWARNPCGRATTFPWRRTGKKQEGSCRTSATTASSPCWTSRPTPSGQYR